MEKKVRKVIYAGSFDPLTNGHIWVIKTVCRLFDEVVIAIGENPDKKYMFSTKQRENHITQVLNSIPEQTKNVTVTTIENKFLVNYAKENNVDCLVRGIRNPNDFDFEYSMNQINRELAPEVDAVYLIPPRELAQISSSMIKGLVGPDGWEKAMSKYVPATVLNDLVKLHS